MRSIPQKWRYSPMKKYLALLLMMALAAAPAALAEDRKSVV